MPSKKSKATKQSDKESSLNGRSRPEDSDLTRKNSLKNKSKASPKSGSSNPSFPLAGTDSSGRSHKSAAKRLKK